MHNTLVCALVGCEAARGEYTLFFFAAIPRCPNGHIESFQAVCCTKPALGAAKIAPGKMDVLSMIEELACARYISADLRKAESLMEIRKNKVALFSVFFISVDL